MLVLNKEKVLSSHSYWKMHKYLSLCTALFRTCKFNPDIHYSLLETSPSAKYSQNINVTYVLLVERKLFIDKYYFSFSRLPISCDFI